MIKIDLNEFILQKHLAYCNGTEIGVSKSRISLYTKLNETIEHCNDTDLKEILISLLQNFKTLVIGNPLQLEKLKEKVTTKITSTVVKERLPKLQTKRKQTINRVLENIFVKEYDRFTDRNVKSPDLWWAYTFVQAVNISVCPYCNSQFIFTHLNDNGRTRPVLDHFFCKSEYPFLAISIYNLIPCCKVCNSDLKGSTKVDLINYINPYIHQFEGNVSFKREFVNKPKTKIEKNDYFSAIIGESNDFKITLDFTALSEGEIKQYKNQAELFQLEEIYKFHKDYIKNLIVKSRIYSDIYTKQIKSSYSKLFQSNEDLRQILIPREDQMNNIILSKLTRDIINKEITNNIENKR
ncbi:hypothetical protein COK36_17875 [Bacillus cereus]|uniref:hypothetical protein n=1 Tax=Bacillus cereus TaxID=1396 RepID=UPI000BF25237|nr:hypothetical protein [Bacillus cereus]PFL22833.1 hypothetical protein COJ22_16210 [Bacillus cereus]PFR59937.1 hypothetical protein COK36_17875 [Bacillus cereus]PGW95248.1 hypothetical protein COE19_11145 [Bacillus cereus]PGY92313.1 hypothetical protein COE38_15635 [Bacillus cereus]PGZ32220.1 hypothetical protein COE54_22365 [Bacillus cereus]